MVERASVVVCVGRALLLIAVILVVSGCAAHRMKQMVGKTEFDVLREWGPPTHSLPDGKGGRVLVYRKVPMGGGTQLAAPNPQGMSSSEYVGASMAHGFAQGLNNPRPSNRMFFLDSAGVVYDWSIVSD